MLCRLSPGGQKWQGRWLEKNIRWVEDALGGFRDMELTVGNVDSWVESFLEAAVNIQEEEEKVIEEEMEEKDRSCMLATWQCFSGGLEQAVRHSCRPSGITRCRNAPGFTKPSLIQACSCIILNLTVFVSVCWRRSSIELLFMEQVEKYKYKYKYKCKYKCKCKFKYKYILCAAHTSWSSLMRMPEARHFAGCLNKHVFVVVFFTSQVASINMIGAPRKRLYILQYQGLFDWTTFDFIFIYL